MNAGSGADENERGGEMGLERTYNLKCDGCGKVHRTTCQTPRRARAVAKRDGWGRRQIVIREYQIPNWIQTQDGLWIQAGKGTQTVYDTVGRDFCPACLDKDGA